MDEAYAFMQWIEKELNTITRRDQPLQLMYGLDGHLSIKEGVLPHLEGYKKLSPVRIGNAAFEQLQLDIYGELIDSIYLFNKYGGPITYEFWQKWSPKLSMCAATGNFPIMASGKYGMRKENSCNPDLCAG
jgi:GH15 family glucan-1,4-alpha-glucosidase